MCIRDSLNTIYFGSGYYCVYDAAEGYFDKEPGQMNDYESTLLAGIPNAPSVYALTNRPELAAQRQRTVLECMVEQKYLTNDEAETILKWGEQAQQDVYKRQEHRRGASCPYRGEHRHERVAPWQNRGRDS